MKTNILDYVDWRGDLSFKQSPFNEVDNVVFTMLIYMDLKRTMQNAKSTYPTFSEAVDTFFQQYDYKTYRFGAILPNEIKDLALKAQKSKRYGQMLILDYVKEVSIEKRSQFGAAAFLLDDGTITICFEGTDDNIVGWYEDAMLAVYDEVLAQKKAVEFLNKIGMLFPNKKINLCGHSKGGNLAFYASIFANDDIKERIIHMYNTDGPGLVYSRYDEEKCKIIDEKGISVLPNSAVVGSLFEIRGEIRIVQSKEKNVFQHNPFSLIVLGNELVRADKFTKSAQNIQKAAQKFMLGTDKNEILQCANDIYISLYDDRKYTLMDLKFIDYNIIFKLVKMVKKENNVFKKFVTMLINNNAFIK